MSPQGRRLATGGRAFRDCRCQRRRVDEDRAPHQRGRQVVVRDRHGPAAVTGREADGAEVVPGRDAEVDRTRGGRCGARRGRAVLDRVGKYASSAVTRFRRSDFIEAMYAFAFVLANFGIAMAAKMPMITTTISSSMSVKPLRFI